MPFCSLFAIKTGGGYQRRAIEGAVDKILRAASKTLSDGIQWSFQVLFHGFAETCRLALQRLAPEPEKLGRIGIR